VGNTESPAVLDIEIHETGAIAYGRIHILQDLMPHFLASPEETCRQRARLSDWPDMHGAVRSRSPLEVFRAQVSML
jgi:hypothetical protein